VHLQLLTQADTYNFKGIKTKTFYELTQYSKKQEIN